MELEQIFNLKARKATFGGGEFLYFKSLLKRRGEEGDEFEKKMRNGKKISKNGED